MKLFSFFALLAIALPLAAQVEITGNITDEDNLSLEMANVFAVNPETKSVAAFCTTDAKGRYKLKLKSNTSYTLKASFVGMETFQQLIVTKEENLNIPIQLKISNKLQEVNIVHKMPVSVKGDTLVYNADSFTTGTERKLEDVLKKLPGVEVENNGDIKVQGKKVKKIMVEGKNFFDGNTKLASKNIPADAVDKVEVLKNHNDVSQLRPVMNNEESLAMNIKLKEGKKHFWFGEIAAGSGTDKHYIAHPKLFYYSPKYSLNFIGDLNDIGEQPFTWSDYFKLMGSFPKSNKGTKINSNIGLSSLLLPNDKLKSTRSQFGAGNFNYSPSQKWTFNGFAIYSKGKTHQESSNQTSYLQNTDKTQLKENSSTQNQQESKLLLFKFKSQYKPNVNNQLDYQLLANSSRQQQENVVQSSILNNIAEFDNNEDFSLKQSLNYYLTLNEKHIFAFNFQHLWQKENPLYRVLMKNFSFAGLLSFQSNSPHEIHQNQKLKTHKADFNAEYFYVLSPKSNLNFSLGHIWTQQKFDNQLFQPLPLTSSKLSKMHSNTVNYTIQDFYTGIHYRFLTGKFTFNPGFTIHQYFTKNQQKKQQYSGKIMRLLPDFSLTLKLRNTESCYFHYAMQTEFADAKKLAENYVLYGYNYLFSGNPQLEEATYHNFTLNYRSFSSFNFTNSYFGINYSRKINDVKNSSDIEKLNRITTPYNSHLADENFSGYGNFQKTFRNFKWSIGANLSYAISHYILQKTSAGTAAKKKRYRSFVQNYNTRFSSNLESPLNFDLGYNFQHNRYAQSENTTNYYTHSPFAAIELVFLKNFVLRSKYTYNQYRQGHKTLEKYSFWNATLRYQPKNSKWEFELSGENLLNNKIRSSNFANEYMTASTTYAIQPRFALLQLRYKL